VIAAARQCRGNQTAVPFTAIRPSEGDNGSQTAFLAEDSEYDDEQARLAGIQRLLGVAGYDVSPIDGVDGPKTQGALTAFLKSRNLPADFAQNPKLFDALLDAAQAPSPDRLTWCNDTPHRVMAAIATEDGKAITSRGWYRIEPGKCVHPDVAGQPRQLFSFAEAVDSDGRPLRFRDKPLVWGGPRQLCTRESKFEVNDHSDCTARGFNAAGFAPVEPGGARTLRLGMP
jgi:uncharacterized membrane protein